jgi:hypothetical protein
MADESLVCSEKKWPFLHTCIINAWWCYTYFAASNAVHERKFVYVFSVSWGGVRLRTLVVDHYLAYCTSPGWWMIMSVEQLAELLARETKVLGENLPQVPLSPPQIPQELTRAVAVGSLPLQTKLWHCLICLWHVKCERQLPAPLAICYQLQLVISLYVHHGAVYFVATCISVWCLCEGTRNKNKFRLLTGIGAHGSVVVKPLC